MSLEKAEQYLEHKESTATVTEAAGDDHSAVRLSVDELEQIAGAKGWVDVCKEA